MDSTSHLPLAQAVGWTVLHFLWQGTLIAAVASVALGLLRSKSANSRYVLCGGVLALMLAAPLITFSMLPPADRGAPGTDLTVALSEIVGFAGGQRWQPLLPWIALSWLTGFSLLQCRTWTHWARAQRLKRRRTRRLSIDVQRTVAQLCDHIGVRRAVRVVESTVADVPTLIGWLSPVILIPTAALCGLSEAQLRAVLAHELAHVRRHDTLVNLLQATIESLLFFHPAVWWISDRMRIEREYCCDDVAVQACGDTLVYAHALSTLENMRAVPAPAVALNGGSLMNRIIRLVGKRSAGMSDYGTRVAPLMLATALAFLFGAVGLTLASGPQAETPPKPAQKESRENKRDKASDDQAAQLRLRIAQLVAEELQRQDVLEHQRDIESERNLERARALVERAAMESDSQAAQRELQRAIQLERDEAREQEHSARQDLERALSAEREAAEISARESWNLEREELERMRDTERRRFQEMREIEIRELEDFQHLQRAERESARERHDLSQEEFLRRELAERESALEQLSLELKELRHLIHLNETGKIGRKELQRRAAQEKEDQRDIEKDEARKAREQEQIF